MNKVFTRSFVTSMKVLLLLLAVALLNDAHFIAGCSHAFASTMSSCTGSWHSIGKWYHSWDRMQQVIPLVLVFLFLGRFLLSKKGRDGEDLRPGRVNWFKLRGEAGLACLVVSYLTLVSGISSPAFQTAMLTATAFLIVNNFGPELRLAFKKWQAKYSTSRRLQVKVGDPFGYENPDGAWVVGPIKEIEDEFYCLDVEDSKVPGEFWDVWVPRLKFTDGPWKHRKHRFQTAKPAPPATTEPTATETTSGES